VKDFIYSNTFLRNHKTLPSYLTLIPLIYFRYHFNDKWNVTKGIDRYLIRTLIAGAFSGSPDSLIDKCTRNISEHKEFNVLDIFNIIKNDGRNLNVSKNILLGIHYDSKEIHMLFNYWYGFNYEPSYPNNQPQIDHIFPQSKLREIKVMNPRTGRKDILRYKWQDRDQFANLMLLTAKENGAGGKTNILPEQWFEDKDEDYLELHLIPRERRLWKIENYLEFIQKRKELIIEKFSEILINEDE